MPHRKPIPALASGADLFVVLKTVNELMSGNDDYERLVVNPQDAKAAQFTIADLVRYTLNPQ